MISVIVRHRGTKRESEGSFYPGNFNLLLHSLGGDVVLLYASKYHDVHNVINLSRHYDLKKGIGERIGKDFLERIKQQGFIDVKDGNSRYHVTEESLMERLNTDMHQACLKIDKECRILTVHGSALQQCRF